MKNLIAIVVSLLSVTFSMGSVHATDSAADTQPAPSERPNILWLSCEDIGPQLGCYGVATVKTPTIDALASRSLTYDNAWSNYPVCAPARTTIITGMYATALGAGNMRCNALKHDSVKLLPELMREAGYYCTNATKNDYNFFAPGEPKAGFAQPGNPWDQCDRKAHWKNGPDGKPFFAVFNNTKTHESKIRKRPHEPQIDPASVSLSPYWPDTPEVRTDWAQYLDNIQTMDNWLARHLADLEKAGLADDTVVVFFGDHGAGMPRHKRYAGDSGMRVPMIVHVPEKWKSKWPSGYKPGARTSTPMGFVDLAPSMLHLAGVEIPKRMQGQSIFAPEFADNAYNIGFRNRMDERNDVSRSITDGKHVYIRNYMPELPHGQFIDYQQQTPTTSVWLKMFHAGKLNAIQSAFWKPRAMEELYDLQADPHETNNLADDPSLAASKAKLAAALDAKIDTIGDLDLVPESDLFQFEQKTGKPRTDYKLAEGFSLGQIHAVAKSTAANPTHLNDPQAAVRYWTLQRMLSQPKATRMQSMEQIHSMFTDDSLSVQVKAAEVTLSCEQHVSDAITLLLHHANCNNSDYYLAGNCLDCLDRYSAHLTEAHLKAIVSLPAADKRVKRGGDNLEKLLKRFKLEAMPVPQ